MAPMVHWPEVMVTYESTDKILFSADAFGTFGALAGNLYADEVNFAEEWLPDARRYYTNIVGKYGDQVSALLEKAAGLEIKTLCPLHGPIWREGHGNASIAWFIDKYWHWATYTPEDNAVMIAYASVYGNTASAADILAGKLAERGVKNIVAYDVSITDSSHIVSESFRCSHLVFASTTYNAGIFIKMEEAHLDQKKHNLQNRKVALIENGSWAPASGSLMADLMRQMPGMEVMGSETGSAAVSISSGVKDAQLKGLEKLADSIVATMPPTALDSFHVAPHKAGSLDAASFFKFSYGLFVLSARGEASAGKSGDNACLINTGIQITDEPKLISIAVNRANYTNEMIKKTGVFNLSILSVDAPYSIFQRFGFQSGRDTDKFADYYQKTGLRLERSANGVYYLPGIATAVMSGKVIGTHEYATHTVFIAEVTEAIQLSNVPSMTYQYYFDHVKPKKPLKRSEPKKGPDGKPIERWVCKICGYVHEGPLPDDYVCPICKHGKDVFEKME
jgi:flavin reductase (DIM6/NTAB) family NADH-FMN oxidoreductase RutF/rubredoxin/flavodoxin